MRLCLYSQSPLSLLQVTVVLPERTPPAYAQHCSELGADVVLCGNSYEDAYAYAKNVHSDSKQMLIRYNVTSYLLTFRGNLYLLILLHSVYHLSLTVSMAYNAKYLLLRSELSHTEHVTCSRQ